MVGSDVEPLSVQSPSGRVKAEFLWRDDRYVHRIYVDQVCVGESLEGDGEVDWPPSPPIRQLALEAIDGRMVALGVGAAGRSHWSISVVTSPNHDSAIGFELACRCNEPTEFLGSSYQLAGSLCLHSTDADVVSRGDIVRVRARAATAPTRRWSYWLSAS